MLRGDSLLRMVIKGKCTIYGQIKTYLLENSIFRKFVTATLSADDVTVARVERG